MGVLPAHANLVTTLKPGELIYTKGGKPTHFAVGEGLVEVTGTTTRILTDMAVGVADIDEKAVEAALEQRALAAEEAASATVAQIKRRVKSNQDT